MRNPIHTALKILAILILSVQTSWADEEWKAYEKLKATYTFDQATGKIRVEVTVRQPENKVKVHARTDIALLESFSFFVIPDPKRNPDAGDIVQYHPSDDFQRQFHEWSKAVDKNPKLPPPTGDIRGNELPEVEISKDHPLVKECFIWELPAWEKLKLKTLTTPAVAKLNFTCVPMVRTANGEQESMHSAVSSNDKDWILTPAEIEKFKNLQSKEKTKEPQKKSN